MSDELDKLDRLAAEKVMGWELPSGFGYYCDSHGAVGPDDFKDWQPTRNIAQAWEMLEKTFVETSLSVSIDKVHDFLYPDLRGWCLRVDVMGYELYAPTAPHAIVLACLKAKGVEV